MELDSLKWWHWMVIGVLVGLAFGAVRIFYGPEFDTDVMLSLTQGRFERDLVQTNPRLEQIASMRIYPKQADGNYWITGTIRRPSNQPFDPKKPDGPRKIYMDTYMYPAADPYKPSINAPDKMGPDFSIFDYLKALKAKYPNSHTQYSYAWWTLPKMTLGLYAAGGFVLVGLIWPLIINLITGRGFAITREKKSDYDLSRFGGGADAATDGGRNAKGQPQLDEVEAALAARLQGGGSISDGAEEQEDSGVPRLSNAPLTPQAPAVEAAQTPKEFAGEYYPVARPGGDKPKEE